MRGQLLSVLRCPCSTGQLLGHSLTTCTPHLRECVHHHCPLHSLLRSVGCKAAQQQWKARDLLLLVLMLLQQQPPSSPQKHHHAAAAAATAHALPVSCESLEHTDFRTQGPGCIVMIRTSNIHATDRQRGRKGPPDVTGTVGQCEESETGQAARSRRFYSYKLE